VCRGYQRSSRRSWCAARDQPPADTTKPTITLTTPAYGATYSLNQAVNANYSCEDEAGGSGLKSCQGTVANGSAIDTASTGTKTFTVTATDNAGNQNTTTRTYVVSDCTIMGTSGDDTLNGTSKADVICGLGGNDTINSSGGNDVLRGGLGNDILVDLSGKDKLFGDACTDQLNSRDGDKVDEVNGGDGVDTCQADRQRRQGQRLSVEPAPKRSCLASSSTKGRSYSSPDPSRANSPLSGPPSPRSRAPKAGTPGIIAEIAPRLAW
jgi:hypothetical protein